MGVCLGLEKELRLGRIKGVPLSAHGGLSTCYLLHSEALLLSYLIIIWLSH